MDGRTDRLDEAKVAFPNFANAPKNIIVFTKPKNEGKVLREFLSERSQTNLHVIFMFAPYINSIKALFYYSN
jgi:hypothetical protein